VKIIKTFFLMQIKVIKKETKCNMYCLNLGYQYIF